MPLWIKGPGAELVIPSALRSAADLLPSLKVEAEPHVSGAVALTSSDLSCSLAPVSTERTERERERAVLLPAEW